MPLPNSVLRRYTPPTCTLEIAAKISPLSRWAGKSISKDLRFELRFDDPRHSEEQRVTIRGNAQDLEVLSDAVNSYIQNFLESSSVQLPLNLGMMTNGNSTPAHPTNGNHTAHLSPIVNPSEPTIPQTSEQSINHLPANSPHSFESQTSTEIGLQPKGLLSHELVLGQLATAESGHSVDLSVLQLFDLATALDEYAAEVMAQPSLNSPLPWKKAPPAWTSAAAMVLLAVGVTGGIAYFNQQNKPQLTASKTGQPTPGITPLSPLLVPVAPVVISPLPTPVVPPALATLPKLPPPTPVSIPAPGTVIPPGVPTPNTSINSSPGAPAVIALVPRRPTIPRSSGISSLPAPLISQRNATNSAAGSTPPTQASIPSAPSAPPSLDGLPKLSPSQSPGVTTAQVPSPSAAARNARASGDLNQTESTQAAKTATSRLSDTIPQVAEARSYFQQRWKPPSGLTQTLEYYLVLNGDGSIQRITPLGNAAGKYIDTTGIPLLGEPFVSPVTGVVNPKIRVVFTKDGKVETFLDQSN